MKALACGACGDIRALDPTLTPQGYCWVECRCGRVQARWTDAMTGKAEFRGSYPHAFVLGLNNHMLMPALRGETAMFEDARRFHDVATDAPDHVFDKSRASCWAVIVKPGRSNDVVWLTEDQ